MMMLKTEVAVIVLAGETIQLKTFHEEKEQTNTEKTPSEPSDTQVVVNAAAMACVLGVPSCLHVIHLSFRSYIFSPVTRFCLIIMFSSVAGSSAIARWKAGLRSNAGCSCSLCTCRRVKTTQHVSAAFVLISVLRDLNWLCLTSVFVNWCCRVDNWQNYITDVCSGFTL